MTVVLWVALGMLTPAILTARPTASAFVQEKALVRGDNDTEKLVQTLVHRIRSQSHLKQIGRALLNFHSTYGHLPAPAIYDKNGKALLSWRVAILPFLELKERKTYQRFKLDEPWDSPNNKKLLVEMPDIYARASLPKPDSDRTPFLALVGKGAGFEPKRKLRVPADFQDGTANTILVIEAGTPVPWTKPEEIAYTPGQSVRKQSLFPREDFNALFADGSVRLLSKNASEAGLRNAVERNDGLVLPTDVFVYPWPVKQSDLKQLPEENARLKKVVDILVEKLEHQREELEVLQARKQTGNPNLDATALRQMKKNRELRDSLGRILEELERLQVERDYLRRPIPDLKRIP
jgi:prepilin-type processing-associated H-X9-DG protein